MYYSRTGLLMGFSKQINLVVDYFLVDFFLIKSNSLADKYASFKVNVKIFSS